MNFKFLEIYIILIVINSIFSQLTLLSPPFLSSKFINNTINMEYGKVGLLTDFYIRGQIILDTISPAREACSPLTGINLRKSNNTLYDENFKILLSYKGSCPISQKARNAQNAGASMLILIDKENTILNNEIFQETGDDITIGACAENSACPQKTYTVRTVGGKRSRVCFRFPSYFLTFAVLQR